MAAGGPVPVWPAAAGLRDRAREWPHLACPTPLSSHPSMCVLLLLLLLVARQFRRTKWIYIIWSGTGVSTVKRARAASQRGVMKTRLGATSVDIEATALEDVTLDAVIAKVRPR